MTLNMQRIIEKYTEKITDYGYKDEYGYYNDWFDGVRPIIKEMANFIRQETLEEMEREIKIKMPTKKTKVIIDTGGKDIYNTTPESLVAMGFLQALSDITKLLQSKKEIKL